MSLGGVAMEPRKELPDLETTIRQYDEVIEQARRVMIAKTHDYGAAWRDMRLSSITDQILIKVKRIKRLEELQMAGEKAMVSEGIDAEYRDILNYCVFALVKLSEERQRDP